MTSKGGANDTGIMFKILPDGKGYMKLLDFQGIQNGSLLTGSLIFNSNFLYGTTRYGAFVNAGTVFKYDITTGTIDKNDEVDIIIYPNPNNGIFHLEMGNLVHENVEIYNLNCPKQILIKLSN